MREAYVTMKVYWNDSLNIETPDMLRAVLINEINAKQKNIHVFITSIGGITKR